MRFAGIDYGKKRVGIAVSDDDGVIAFPKIVIENSAQLLPALAVLVKNENISEFVLGESVNSKGEANKISKDVENFAVAIQKVFKLPVHMEKEFFSSSEAHGRIGKSEKIARKSKLEKVENLDAKAAAVILQRFLDRRNKNIIN